MKPLVILAPLFAGALLWTAKPPAGWRHLSVKAGDIAAPNTGTQQTGSAVFDIDRDGVNDFVITERTAAPAVVWYRRQKSGWQRYVIEPDALHIEAGATYGDVDGDGDLDLIAGGDYKSSQVWWWENPYPNYDPAKGWVRHTLKISGLAKHHDLLWGDFDGDGRPDLAFWNQNARKLELARVPANPRDAREWPTIDVYEYGGDSEQEQRAEPAPFKSVNEHEGLAAADIDGDGTLDLVGGGMWFKYMGHDRFQANLIDGGYPFSRAVAGQLIEGGRPEVVLVVGDGVGPLILYEWVKGTWLPHRLLDRVNNGHSLALADFDGDGHMDIFCAEMRLDGGNPDSKMWILYGDGKGHFEPTIVARGYDSHESKVADLDGDGRLDILGKPYNFQTPDLNIWLRRE